MDNDPLPDPETLRELAENSPDKLERILRANIAALIEEASESQPKIPPSFPSCFIGDLKTK